MTTAWVFKRGFIGFLEVFPFFPDVPTWIDQYTMAGQRISKQCACVRVSEQDLAPEIR